MAEIPVEKKSGIPWWVWLILLLLIGLLLWWLLADDEEAVDPALTDETAIEEPIGEQDLAEAPAEDMTLSAILANPDAYVGRDDFTGQFDTGDVPTDRGFWITENGEQLFALIEDQPREVPLDINPGQTLEINGGTLHDRSYLGEIGGVPIDDDTRAILEEQEIFLVVDENNVTIR